VGWPNYPIGQTLQKKFRFTHRSARTIPWPSRVVRTHHFYFLFFLYFAMGWPNHPMGVVRSPQTSQGGGSGQKWGWSATLLLSLFISFFIFFQIIYLFLFITKIMKYWDDVVLRLNCRCWRGQTVTQSNGVNKIGWKMNKMTKLKNAKKLMSKCLKLKSERLFSNRSSTQGFIIQL
jgi:hypothetical protein